MTHEEMQDRYELYALGALEPEEAIQIDQHLAEQCLFCLEHIGEALNVTAALSGLTDSLEAPASVRNRLLAGLQPERAGRRWSFVSSALAAACVALLFFGVWSGNELNRRRNDLDRAYAQRDRLRSALEILSRSQTKSVQFGTSDNAAHGRVFVNKTGGFVFVGSELPQIASDKIFELWLIPAKGAPAPAGTFRANAGGDFVQVSETAVDPNQVAAVAVTIEPGSGSPAPTTKPILVVPLG